MLIIIFGASGKVGRLAVTEALARGHSVRAFVHIHHKLAHHPNLTIVKGDVHNAAAIRRTVCGCDAVISALGSWGTKEKDILSTGMRHIVPIMEQAGIERIVTVTGAGARDDTDKFTLLQQVGHGFISAITHRILLDAEKHIQILRSSSLNWTALRSPIMTNSPRIFYKLSLQPPAPWATVSCQAVAKALIDQLDGPAYSRAAPFIHAY